ncbi:hypothetical protein ACFX15_006545 [Malus domestica]
MAFAETDSRLTDEVKNWKLRRIEQVRQFQDLLIQFHLLYCVEGLRWVTGTCLVQLNMSVQGVQLFLAVGAEKEGS